LKRLPQRERNAAVSVSVTLRDRLALSKWKSRACGVQMTR